MKRVSRGAAGGGGRERVLYVEDDVANWNVAKLQMGDSYDLVRASDASDAFKALRTQQFHAVLLDLQLRGSSVDGLGIARILRFGPSAQDPADAAGLPESTKDLPLIIVTAFADTLKEETIAASGVDQVITKPVNFTRLSLAIANTHLRRVAARSARAGDSDGAPGSSTRSGSK